MLFYEYVVLGPALLTATSVFSLVHIETKHARSSMSSPPITNDTVIEVIKNISRVNNALQELINNYEQLQNIYKTESFESSDDYSTDSEIDERYRYDKQRQRNGAELTTEKPLNGFPATKFMAFEDTHESSATDTTAEESKTEGATSDTSNYNRLPTIENLHAKSSTSKNEIKPDSKESSVSVETVVEEKVPMQTTSTKKVPRIFFIDTHILLKNISKSTHRPHASVQQIQHGHVTAPKQKTRYKKVDHRSDLRTKTKKGSEVIGNTRPDKAELRNGAKDPELPSFNKVAHKGNQDTKNKDSDSDSAAEDREMNKEIFKTHVLRQAYGDSCTKLVVKKCFKACKETAKRSCSGSCSSGFKTAFLVQSRTGCITQFEAQKTSSASLRAGGIDFPNDEYLTAAACWPLLGTDKVCDFNEWPLLGIDKATLHKHKSNLTSLKLEEQLLLLRTRYEKACRSNMAEKCNKACMYSFEGACITHDCPTKRAGSFKRHCKSECRKVFKQSSSKDSDPSESDSGSGSRSDSSDGDSDSS